MQRNENDQIENIKKYSNFGMSGTSWLAFRDVPELIDKYVKKMRTLDFGCGCGRSTRFLRSLGLNVIGMDVSKAMLEQANQQDPEGQYIWISKSGQLPSVDQTFDFIFSSFVLLVIDSKKNILILLKELYRVLTDDGVLMIITGSEDLHSKNREWLSYDIDFPENNRIFSGSLSKVRNKDVGAIFYDYNWFDSDYRELFDQAGLKVILFYQPLGKSVGEYNWKSETQASPHAIYVLQKV